MSTQAKMRPMFMFFSLQINAGKERKWLIRFGLMHLIATNLCIWIRVLVREVMEGIEGGHHYSQYQLQDMVDAEAAAGPPSGN